MIVLSKKRIKLVALVIACIMAIGALPVYAENTASCSVNGSSYSVMGTAESESVNVIIMPADENAEDITLEELNSNSFIAFSVANSDGSYSKSFNLPTDFAEGEYKTVIYDGAGYIEKYFIFGSGTYKKETVVSKIKNGGLSAVVERYGSEYGMDAEVYNAQKDSVKKELNTRLAGTEITDLASQYDKTLKEAIFDMLETASELKPLLVLTGSDFTDFDNLTATQQTAVLSKTFKNLPDTVEELNSVFEKYSEEGNKKPQGGGSGGGGGGGSASSDSTVKGPSAGTPLVEEKPVQGTAVLPSIGNGSSTAMPVTALPDTVNHWAREYITELNELGIITGYDDGNFYPERNITRAEFTKMIAVTMGVSVEGVTEGAFSDVAQDSWYGPYVYALSGKGYINGYDNGNFYPDNLITREDTAVIIHRVLTSNGNMMETDAEFTDSADISGYAKEAVAKLGGEGILTGSDGKVNPKSNLTRAEAAAIISRLLSKITEGGI